MALISAVSGGSRYTGNLYNINPRRRDVLWIILSAFIEAGWRIVKSGDGLSTYSSTSESALTNNDVTDTTNYEPNDGTTFAKIAGSTANNKAWFVVKPAAGATHQAELCLQQIGSGGDLNDYQFRAKFSVGGFSAGSPSATRVPAAAAGDEVVLCGGGTDASPTGTEMLSWDLGFRFNLFIDSSSATPYAWCRCWVSASDSIVLALDWDLLTNLKASGDVSPYAVRFGPGTLASITTTTDVDLSTIGYGLRIGASGTTKALPLVPSFLDGTKYYDGIGLSTVDSTEEPEYVLYARPASAATYRGRKGISTRNGWRTTARSFADHLTIASVRTYVHVENMWLPWPVTGTACTR